MTLAQPLRLQRVRTLVNILSLALLPSVLNAQLMFPPGERATDLPDVIRAIPQKESYETYDPVIGRNFDLKNFWIRADLRVRPEWRTGVCFGGGAPIAGACNQLASTGSGTSANGGRGATDFYVQQWARLGVGYDLSPDINFYLEVTGSSTWGGNGDPSRSEDPSSQSCSSIVEGACRLGVRAAYALVRNLGGIQGLSLKAGRQYVVFGNQRVFGHFDWANTGYSHDGIMFQYSAASFESSLGWFRNAETDLTQGTPLGSLTGNIGTPPSLAGPDGSADADFWILYNQIKSVPSFLIEPYYVLYSNHLREDMHGGLFTPKAASQLRHMIGMRVEMRKGNWDYGHESAYQFGSMADGIGTDNQRNVHINAWASGTWLGYTHYSHRWKPRLAIGFDYASGDGDANCVTLAGVPTRPCGGNANTFENFFPTNYLHVGYMLNGAWRNMVQPHINVQARPTARDHIEVWGQRKYLVSARDNWYRGSQSPLVFSKADNMVNHVGDEIDVSWTHMFADGKISFNITYGHFIPGPYVQTQLGTSSRQDWGIIQLWMNF